MGVGVEEYQKEKDEEERGRNMRRVRTKGRGREVEEEEIKGNSFILWKLLQELQHICQTLPHALLKATLKGG